MPSFLALLWALLSLLAIINTASAAAASRGIRGHYSKLQQQQRLVAGHRTLQDNKEDEKEDEKENDKEEDDGAVTIMDILSEREDDFSTLVGLLEDADLAEALEGEGPFTLLAPTNAAFEALDPETLEAVQDDPNLLEQVLLYHVVEGDFLAADLVGLPEGTQVETLNPDNNLTVAAGNSSTTVITPAAARASNNKPLTLAQLFQALQQEGTQEGLLINGAAMVTEADLLADNGVIHGIDAVLIPEVIQEEEDAPQPEEEDEDEEEEEEEEEEEDEGNIALEDLFGCVVESLTGGNFEGLFGEDVTGCGETLLDFGGDDDAGGGDDDGEGDGEDLVGLQPTLNCLGLALGCEAEVAAANAATGYVEGGKVKPLVVQAAAGAHYPLGGDLYDLP